MERHLADLVNAAYGLTAADVALLWRTAPAARVLSLPGRGRPRLRPTLTPLAPSGKESTTNRARRNSFPEEEAVLLTPASVPRVCSARDLPVFVLFVLPTAHSLVSTMPYKVFLVEDKKSSHAKGFATMSIGRPPVSSSAARPQEWRWPCPLLEAAAARRPAHRYPHAVYGRLAVRQITRAAARHEDRHPQWARRV